MTTGHKRCHHSCSRGWRQQAAYPCPNPHPHPCTRRLRQPNCHPVRGGGRRCEIHPETCCSPTSVFSCHPSPTDSPRVATSPKLFRNRDVHCTLEREVVQLCGHPRRRFFRHLPLICLPRPRRLLVPVYLILMLLHGELEVRRRVPFAKPKPEERVPPCGLVFHAQHEVSRRIDHGLDRDGGSRA